MGIRLINNCNGYKKFKVEGSKSSYDVYCLDGVYLCECAILNRRDIKNSCKHIEKVKNYLNNIDPFNDDVILNKLLDERRELMKQLITLKDEEFNIKQKISIIDNKSKLRLNKLKSEQNNNR